MAAVKTSSTCVLGCGGCVVGGGGRHAWHKRQMSAVEKNKRHLSHRG